jgi:hypothetical protein
MVNGAYMPESEVNCSLEITPWKVRGLNNW